MRIKNVLLFSIITLLVGGGIFYWAIGAPADPSVTDTFTDETKIFSKENLVISGGQVKLTDVCYGIADNAQVLGCDGTCQACQGGTCSLANAGTDPGDNCTTGSTSADGCRGNNCDGTGACQVISSGEGGCPACQKCTDADIACENYSNYTKDTTAPNTCTGTHYCCVSGGCGKPKVEAIIPIGWWLWCIPHPDEPTDASVALVECAALCSEQGYHGATGVPGDIWMRQWDEPNCKGNDFYTIASGFGMSWYVDTCRCWRCP